MARKLVSIVRISKVSSIENADRLEVVEMDVKGWKVVTQKGEFKVGDLGVMFEIDSFLPSDDERYAFLRERCLRKFVSKSGNVLREGIKIKTIKLRGVISQGLLIPIDKFPEITSKVEEINNKRYKKFCIDNDYVGSMYFKTSAEIAYRYLQKELDFIEAHTALNDAEIESIILAKALKKGKVTPTLEFMPCRKLGTVKNFTKSA